MPAAQTWLTQSAAVAELQSRLNSQTFWTPDEIWLYITEGLRLWNGLCELWPGDFTLTGAAAEGGWINLGTLAAPPSPRLRTQTDAALYTAMQYRLLEPPTGAGAWTGTSQFSLINLQAALQARVQEVVQAAACNLAVALHPVTPGTRRILLADSTLQPRRCRWLPAAGYGLPVTLTREDDQAFQWFEPSYLQTAAAPQSWSMTADGPIPTSIDLDFAPQTAGQLEVLFTQASAQFAPPTATLLAIPDDWTWLPLYGALADLLSAEPEASDPARAAYCLDRYTSGLEFFRNSNWLLQGQITGVPADTPSLSEMDTYAPEWQQGSAASLPALVQAGTDFLAPTPAAGQSVSLTLVANAPLLDSSATFVQVSRDDWAAVRGYAQHAASFKLAGAEFAATAPLLQDFYRAAAAVNRRLLTYGIFVDILKSAGQRQETQEVR